MKKDKIVALTLGDPGGIGPEVSLKALDIILKKKPAGVKFLLIGPPEIFEYHRKKLGLKVKFNIVDCVEDELLLFGCINILDIGDDTSEVEIGKVSVANAALSYHSLEVGAYLAKEGIVAALVTAPINKEAVSLVSPRFRGHTEYLARLSKVKNYAMMLAGEKLRVVLVTTHLPLKDVPYGITKKMIYDKILLTKDFLSKRLKIRNPKIAVASLNPHAGEGGKIGREEKDLILPAVKTGVKAGVKVFGPVPADIVFYKALSGEFDAVVSMYHDQALGPFKMLHFHDGVNITIGLPFIRTSPDHGTAFDIAYKWKANCESMLAAIKSAVAGERPKNLDNRVPF